VSTWAILMTLLLATWGVAQINLHPLNVVIALAIACTKMVLILLNFMHVRTSSRLTWLFVGAGFFWLGILFMLGMSDYLTRGWLAE
jgi:cytochrome c oxidase subunit 4